MKTIFFSERLDKFQSISRKNIFGKNRVGWTAPKFSFSYFTVNMIINFCSLFLLSYSLLQTNFKLFSYLYFFYTFSRYKKRWQNKTIQLTFTLHSYRSRPKVPSMKNTWLGTCKQFQNEKHMYVYFTTEFETIKLNLFLSHLKLILITISVGFGFLIFRVDV